MRVRLTIFCLALLAAPLRAPMAQDPNTASIPAELATALLEGSSYGLNGQPRIVVGRAPEGMVQSATSLEGGTVLGGATYGRSAVVVFSFTLPPNQVVLSVDRQLRARGWTLPPPPPDANRGGFVSSYYGSGSGYAYCADSTGITLASMPAPRGGTYLKLTQVWNEQFNFCVPRDRARIFGGPEFKFPSLLPPPGMTSQGGGGGSGGNSSSITARLSGPLKPAELLAHYRTQLDAAGWRTRTPVSIGEEAAVAYVEAADSTRAVWHGMMTALQLGPSDVEVEIKMMKARER